MAFDFGAGPKQNPYINYFFAGFMIVCFLVSTSLNPLIFYSYTKKSLDYTKTRLHVEMDKTYFWRH